MNLLCNGRPKIEIVKVGTNYYHGSINVFIIVLALVATTTFSFVLVPSLSSAPSTTATAEYSFRWGRLVSTQELRQQQSRSQNRHHYIEKSPYNIKLYISNNHETSTTSTSLSLHDRLYNIFPDKQKRQSSSSLISSLPIFDVIQDIQIALLNRPNLLLEAPPGAGKTTIVPLALLLLEITSKWSTARGSSTTNKNTILVVEPRRVAARSAAQRMASILNESVGETVGYAIRGEVRQSKNTIVKVVTDGVLLNMLRDDPELTKVSCVIFDEFHERGIGSDTAFALCRETQQLLRPDDLRMVIMSATLLQVENENNTEETTGTTTLDDGTILDTSLSTAATEGNKIIDKLGGSKECTVLQSSGRQYPIQVQWGKGVATKRTIPPLPTLMKSRDMLVSTICNAIEEALVLAPSKGDILVFLPGKAEILRVIRELQDARSIKKDDLEILPLYGALPKKQQDYAIYPPSQTKNQQQENERRRRRIIVSSPIAEASLTIEGVTCVVDSGLRRESRCDVDTNMPRLVTTRCSKASAKQRAGRAGRIQEGLCLRIYSESEFDINFVEHSSPEIKSTDLTPTLLLLSDWGCSRTSDILTELPFVDPPNSDALEKAIDFLVNLNSMERKEEVNVDISSSGSSDHKKSRFAITPIGRMIAKMPIHPRIATAIIRASENTNNMSCLAASVTAAYLLDDELGGGYTGGGLNPDLAPKVRDLFNNCLRDKNHRTLRSILDYASRISDKAKTAIQEVVNEKVSISAVSASVGEALLPGFHDLVAERKGDTSYGGCLYMLANGRSARLDDTTGQTKKEFVVVLDTSTGDDGTTRIRSYVSIDKDILQKTVAIERDTVFTVPSRGHEVRARRVLAVGTIELSSTPLPTPSAEDVEEILLTTIRSLGGVNVALVQTLSVDRRKKIEELCARVRLATKLRSSISSNNDDWPLPFAALDNTPREASVEGGGDPSMSTSNVNDEIHHDNETILEGLIGPWLSGAGSLKQIDLYEALLATLSVDQRNVLDNEFPIRIEAPDGSSIPIQYATGSGAPMASGKLQQFFGTTESPCVGPSGHEIPVVLSLLSPAGKSLAQTSDLPFFWKETYPSVRAEMRGRYAKHPWPEDPMTAIATRQTKKQQQRQQQQQQQQDENAGPKQNPRRKMKKRGKRKR